jgi:hypothetical protein
MDPITESLFAAIEPELGYRERADQYTKYGEWYAQAVQDPQYKKAAWCDMFLAWAANKAGVQDVVGEYAWTPSHARWFEQHDAWTTTPERGALVFFSWSGSKDIKKINHVGIVEKVEDGKIHTIEGNVDKVWLKRKVRDESKVVGYGLPRKVKEFQEAQALALQAAPGQAADGAVPNSLNAAEVGGHATAIPLELVTLTCVLMLLIGTGAAVTKKAVLRPATPVGRHRRTRRTRRES